MKMVCSAKYCSVINFFLKLCAFCDFRLELDGHVDMHRTRRLLCGVCRPDDLPALSGVLSGSVAAQRASERSGRGEPAASAGPRQPQPAPARTLPGYEPGEAWWHNRSISALNFRLFSFAAHWFFQQLRRSFKTQAGPLPLAPSDFLEPQKHKLSSFHSYPSSSTPQK